MWKSFHNIFNLKSDNNNTKPLPWEEAILDENSPSIDTNLSTVKLWNHQKAMLARCKSIEENPHYAETKTLYTERYSKKQNIVQNSKVAIGIMNDIPGSGKTFVILALIALDRQHSLNVIVVPKNLMIQWKNALQTLFPASTGIKWIMCDTSNSYQMISGLYMKQSVFADYRIVLIDEMFIDSFALAYESPIHRLIIDEVDNIEGTMTQAIICKKLWFLSASYSPYNNDTYKLPYKIDQSITSNIICRCNPQFIQKSIKLADPISELIICDDSDIALFINVVPNDIIKSLHACNKAPLKKYIEFLMSDDKTLSELAEWYKIKLTLNIQNYKDELNNLINQINKETTPFVQQALMKNHESIKIKSDKALDQLNHLTINLSSFIAPDETKTKNYRLIHDIFIRIRSKPEQKWLIFNDDLEALFLLQKRLQDNNITNTMLDGGNMEKVASAIADYKDGNTQVLLLQAVSEGAGLNLENTSCVLFMQATNDHLVEQIVGRSQRYGRTDVLKIICLFDKLEHKKIFS